MTRKQADIIRETVQEWFGRTARVWLFGSRADDTARGGDIDLYIETDAPLEEVLSREMKVNSRLQRALGERRIDIVTRHGTAAPKPIHREARRFGVPL